MEKQLEFLLVVEEAKQNRFWYLKSSEFIKDNCDLFGISKELWPPMIGTCLLMPSSYILKDHRILINCSPFAVGSRLESTITDIYHETTHFMHHYVNPEMWEKTENPDEQKMKKAVREIIAENAAIIYLDKLKLLEGQIGLKKFEMPFSKRILHEYSEYNVEEYLPELIKAKTIDDAVEIGLDREYLREIGTLFVENFF